MADFSSRAACNPLPYFCLDTGFPFAEIRVSLYSAAEANKASLTKLKKGNTRIPRIAQSRVIKLGREFLAP